MRSPPFSLPAFLSEKREGRKGGKRHDRRRRRGKEKGRRRKPQLFPLLFFFLPLTSLHRQSFPSPQRNADRSGVVAVVVCGGGGVKNASQNKAPHTTTTRRRAGKNSPPSLLPHSRDFLSKENMRNPFSRHGSEEIKKVYSPHGDVARGIHTYVHHHAYLYCIRSLLYFPLRA